MPGIPEFPIPRARYTYNLAAGSGVLMNRGMLVTKINRALIIEGSTVKAEFEGSDIYRVKENAWRLGLIGPTILLTNEPTLGLQQISLTDDWGESYRDAYIQLDVEGILNTPQTTVTAWRSDNKKGLPEHLILRRLWITKNNRVVGVLEPHADSPGNIGDVLGFLKLWHANEERQAAPKAFIYHIEYLLVQNVK